MNCPSRDRCFDGRATVDPTAPPGSGGGGGGLSLHLKVQVCLLLFYTIAIVFQLHHGGDMMYEMRRRKSKHYLLSIQGIFNLPQHIGMV